MYGSERWPLDRAACLAVAVELDLDARAFERALDEPATQELLERNERDAHARGAFGVPTLFCDGVSYWGNDRLVLLEHALARGAS